MRQFQKTVGVLCLLFWLGVTASGYAQLQSEGQVFVDPAFTYDRWTVEDGLPVNSVNKIIQSSDGYIWFGTFDGLVRFDGIRFKVYKSAEYEGLVSNRITYVEEAQDSSIFIITTINDLVQFKNGTFKHITRDDGLHDEKAYFFFRDNHEQLWIGTGNGVTIYESGTFKPYYPDVVKGQISSFYVDGNKVLWYRDDITSNIYRFDGINQTLIANYEGAEGEIPHFLTLKDGSTLITTLNHIYRFKDGKTQEVNLNHPGSFLVIGMYENTNGSLMLFTKSGELYRLENNQAVYVDTYKENTGTPNIPDKLMSPFVEGNENWLIKTHTIYYDNKPVFSLDNGIEFTMYDREGSLWFGTTSFGLFRLRPNMFNTYSLEEGVPHRNIYPVYEASDTSIWFGTYGKGPVRLQHGQVVTSFEFQPPADRQLTRSIIELDSGELLVSLSDNGIYRFDEQDNTFKRWDGPEQQPNLARPMSIESIFEDSQQRLWVGSNHGLYFKNEAGGKWQRVPNLDSNPDNPVRNIAEAPNGSLWMVTYGDGLLKYHEGAYTTYTTRDGLSSDFIRYIYMDTAATEGDYVVWIGTGDKGLNRLEVLDGEPDFGGLTIYNEQTGLYDNVVHVILPDEFGRFWMSGNKGISWVNRSELERYAAGEIQKINTVYYTEKDGLRNREANGGVQTPGIVASDGTLWVPTQDGLVMINPDDIYRNEVSPPVVIEEIASGDELIPKQSGSVVLNARQRNFEIAYTGLSFMVPEKVHFRYRLKGFNEDWVEAGTRRTAFYTNVPPGTYQFEVLAANNVGTWSREPAVLSVEILPFFYETRLFYLLLLLVAGIGFLLVVRLRTRSLKKREIKLERSVKERTAELETEKKKTEAQAKELLKLDKAKSQFFTNITHEFRTPLTLIIGPLQKLFKKDRELSLEEAHIEIERMLKSSYRLQRLIDQILDVSKLEADELKLYVQRIDLRSFLQTLVELFKPLTEEQEQDLAFFTDTEECYVYLDSDALEKIMANLISNAVKFTPPSGTILIELEETIDECVIKVQDSGIGIPPESIQHIFDRFYQVDDSSTRVAEGSGVGLALVKNLVELHGGTIKVDSETGKETTFTIRFKKGKLHFANEQVMEHTEVNAPLNLNTAEYSSHLREVQKEDVETESDKPAVLIAEDNPDMREFVSSILKDLFSVRQASNGKEALELAENYLPDLIVADIMMPKMDGMELNQKLKNNPMLEGIPVIFLTAKTGIDNKLKGFRDGVDDYLTKPFTPELLVTRVDNLIRKRKKLREYYLGKKSAEKSKKIKDPFLKEVVDILEEHFADPDFGVLELSKTLHLERTHLYRKIKELTTKSPQQFLWEFRMKKAAQMIKLKEGTISEIAYASGFNNLAYFSTAFKRYHKVSPSEYNAQKVM